MAEQQKQPMDRPCEDQPGDEIDLLDYWRVIWKQRRMIGLIAALTVIVTAGISLTITDTYQAKAVIMPVTSRESGGGSVGLAAIAQQFGGLPGITMPGSSSASEIVSLLKSNILREKIIHQYNLMPVLFYRQWDSRHQTWNKGGVTLNPLYYFSLVGTDSVQTQSAVPDTWDALRLLNEIVKINQDAKQNTITIAVDFHDPEMAAKIVEYSLVTLTNYMSSEAKRVAATNRKYLEEQLGSTTDPFIKQKTYNMIAQQIEAGMMAEVKENFAFKVIDPPLAPDKIIRPKRVQMVMLSLLAALFVGVFAAFFREYVEKIRKNN
jgi:uncharacterized protein involved in exopolysaccharide biosynthesis